MLVMPSSPEPNGCAAQHQNHLPPIRQHLINTYRMPSRLLVTGGGEIQSQEGTTQGENLAMVFYGLGTNPLLKQLKLRIPEIK